MARYASNQLALFLVRVIRISILIMRSWDSEWPSKSLSQAQCLGFYEWDKIPLLAVFNVRVRLVSLSFLDTVPDFVKNSHTDSSPCTAREKTGLPFPGQGISHSSNLPTARSKRWKFLYRQGTCRWVWGGKKEMWENDEMIPVLAD